MRAGMVYPDKVQIGSNPGEHVEAAETCTGGRNRNKDRGVRDMLLGDCAIEVKQRKHAW